MNVPGSAAFFHKFGCTRQNSSELGSALIGTNFRYRSTTRQQLILACELVGSLFLCALGFIYFFLQNVCDIREKCLHL